jgi:UDP-2,4-diacetamido-2,4,6-trideoxy-beta-L-altropyranose hydrolase
MKVVFRVDASVCMGTGHLIRCLTLAEALRQRGGEIQFICRDHPGNLLTVLRQKEIPVRVLPAPGLTKTVSGEDYATWLGVPQFEDARQTIAALTDRPIDCLVVDHYGLDVTWEVQVRPHVKKLMVIDDLANRHHDCDVLLDQNFSDEGEARYTGLVPQECRLLVGPRYALLNPEYASCRTKPNPKDGGVSRIFVYFGGSDPQNMTGVALNALSLPALCHLAVDVVVGANNVSRAALDEQAANRGGVRIFGPRPHLADLMMQADLAIGAGGATTWERMCLGLPSVVVSIAENQCRGAKALAKAGLIQYAGHFHDVTSAELAGLIELQIRQPVQLSKVSRQNQLQVDGLGVFRVVEVLCPTDVHATNLRPANDDDVGHFFTWANDPLVRGNAHNSATIPWNTHQVWFANKMRSADCLMYVLEAEGLPVGQIRFERVGNEALIDYSLDTIVRGRDWGHILISLGIERTWPALRLRAEVKTSNTASMAVFRRMGFSEGLSMSSDYLVFHKEPDLSHSRLIGND